MQAATSVLHLRAGLRPAPARRPLSASAPSGRLLQLARPDVRAQAVYNVKFVFPDGSEKSIECPDDQLILDAAEDAGLDLPYACHGGTCSSCCCRILEGQVDQSEQSYLDEGELAKGFALICSSYPESDVVLLTHQESKLQDEALEEMAPAHN